jgi:hypothetical protein
MRFSKKTTQPKGLSESRGPWVRIACATPRLTIPSGIVTNGSHCAATFVQGGDLDRNIATVSAMDQQGNSTVIELRLSYRYIKAHPWVVTAVNGFLSAYFMEEPSFRVRRHFDELESGMHVWQCEVPATMKMDRLVRRLKVDIPPFQQTVTSSAPDTPLQYLIDSPNPVT